jgi:peptidoglycan hydrolase CwlO-like protein
MNFMEYICRGIVRSEDAINRLGKSVKQLAKNDRAIKGGLVYVSIAGALMCFIIAAQEREIQALQQKVEDLANDLADVDAYAGNIASDVEELKNQKGA